MEQKKTEAGPSTRVGEMSTPSHVVNSANKAVVTRSSSQRVNRPHRGLINPFTGKPFGDGLSESAYG